MLDDNRILEFYIGFVAISMKELIQMTIHENELLQKSNILNRKKNLQTIKSGYQQFARKVYCEWEKIYNNTAQFSETTKNEDLLARSKTLFAISLNQRFVEQFFYRLFFAMNLYVMYFNDKSLSKMTSSQLFSDIGFNYVQIVMKKTLKTVLEAMKSHTVKVDDSKKKSFVEINQRLLTDVSINYRLGEEMTDARIEQMLKDIEEGEARKRAEFDEGVKNGNIRINLSIYETEEELISGLERESCNLLASFIGGSSDYYNSLPEVSALKSNFLLDMLVNIDFKAKKAALSLTQTLECTETTAMYVGLIAGYLFMKGLPLYSDSMRQRFLQNIISPVEFANNALSFMGIDPTSDEARKIGRLNDEMRHCFTTNVECTARHDSKKTDDMVTDAGFMAFKLGYHAYFRLKKVLPGNTFEEDQTILKGLPSKISNQGKDSVSKGTANAAVNNTINATSPVKQATVISPKSKVPDARYWLDSNGRIRCPGDACPIDCNTDCPIYAQTLALEKLTKNDFETAAKLLRNAVATEPKFADAWNNLAACYGQMGDHKNAFAAYQRSYEIEQKPNPLYGMAVATKNMKDHTLAMTYAKIYVDKYGSDDRIKAIIVEISENELSEKIKEDISQEKKNEESIIPEASKAVNNQQPDKPVLEKKTDNDIESGEDTKASIDAMRQYGKAFLQLLDPNTRDAGYAEIEKIESSYPEAGVVLGQYYNGIDQQKAKKHFKIAANAEIAEGQWEYANIIPHSDIPDDSDIMDKEWVKYCLAAAEGGCADAANEMGNICHRKGFLEESTYWYGMAYALEHPAGITSLKGITQKWKQKGISSEFKGYTDSFSEERHATALLILEIFTQSATTKTLDNLMSLALKGETLAGFLLAEIFEKNNHDDMAYKVYNALAFGNHPYALRCYADMLLAGKGTARDIEGAFRMYEKAAKGGNSTAMFAMGQKAVKTGDNDLAACWFGQAYTRGMDMAGEWLSKLAGNM